MKYKTEKELIELLRKLLKALQNGKNRRYRAAITDGNHTKSTAAAIIKEKGTVIAITKESTRNFSAAAKSRENIDKMAV
ncbi:hypothetical protein V2177_01840 [Bacillus licheniformis]